MTLNRIPIVAIVGRQNVGKSTLLNRLIGSRLAITQDLPGTTRDRLFASLSHNGRRFTLVDTAGIVGEETDQIARQARAQVKIALAEADLILFALDAKSGLMPLDEEIALELRRTKKPIILAANKVDNPKMENHAAEFYNLGLGDVMAISAYHGSGTHELLDKIVSVLPPGVPETEAEKARIKIAIIGRANVGKSSLLNAILGEERTIVTDIPGTTRDAIDTPIDFGTTGVLLIDTAGIRRRGRIEKGVEDYSVIRSLAAIDRSDVVLLVIDASEGVTAQDTHIAGYVRDALKGVLLVINKWDLVKKLEDNTLKEDVADRFKFMPYAKDMFISAKTGEGVKKILPEAVRIYQERHRRIPTAEVNSVLQTALGEHTPPRKARRQLKLYYATQAEVNPPTFVFSVNDIKLVHFSYQRYLENKFRDAFGFAGTPVKFVFKARGES